MIKTIVVFDIITSKEIICVIDIFEIHDILDIIDPIEIIIICISDNIYIIDTIYTLEIIETSIDIITDEEINDDVNNVNDIFDIHDILDMIDPIEIIIICISGNIFIIDTIYSLDIIETSIDVITDEEINEITSMILIISTKLGNSQRWSMAHMIQEGFRNNIYFGC